MARDRINVAKAVKYKGFGFTWREVGEILAQFEKRRWSYREDSVRLAVKKANVRPAA